MAGASYAVGMLEAKRVSAWRNRYQLLADGYPLTVWEPSSWRPGGSIDLAGQRYQVRSGTWQTRFTMTDGTGAVIAEAERVGRKRWTVRAGPQTYQFQRASWWRAEQVLMVYGRQVGWVRRPSMWRRDAVADLPGLPLPVQVFVLIVVLAMWQAQEHAAASAGT